MDGRRRLNNLPPVEQKATGGGIFSPDRTTSDKNHAQLNIVQLHYFFLEYFSCCVVCRGTHFAFQVRKSIDMWHWLFTEVNAQ